MAKIVKNAQQATYKQHAQKTSLARRRHAEAATEKEAATRVEVFPAKPPDVSSAAAQERPVRS